MASRPPLRPPVRPPVSPPLHAPSRPPLRRPDTAAPAAPTSPATEPEAETLAPASPEVSAGADTVLAPPPVPPATVTPPTWNGPAVAPLDLPDLPELPEPVGSSDTTTRGGNTAIDRRHTIDDDHTTPTGRLTPHERWDPDGAVPLNDLTSRCTAPGLSAGERIDPFYSVSWVVGGSMHWTSVEQARAHAQAGMGRLPSALDMSVEDAVTRLHRTRGWDDRVALLGSLFSWRTLSCEQAAAFTGQASFANPLTRTPAEMYASQIIEMGALPAVTARHSRFGRGTGYRTAPGRAFEEHLGDSLTWAERVSISGGQKWPHSPPHDRHNILAAELGLRFAEYGDVATVLGERFSSIDLLGGSGIGNRPITDDQRAADLTVVRPDGLRIAIEVTASLGTHFSHKVERWARLLAENPVETSGLCIVFVVIPTLEQAHAVGRFTNRSATYQTLARACRRYPGTAANRVAERMGVASWREWFPEAGTTHEAFLAMRVDRPTGEDAALWEPADMLRTTSSDPRVAAYPFAPRDPEAMRAVIDNSALLGQTPYWMRAENDPPDLIPHLLGTRTIPNPESERPERTAGHVVGTARGIAGATRVPPRLRGLRHRKWLGS